MLIICIKITLFCTLPCTKIWLVHDNIQKCIKKTTTSNLDTCNEHILIGRTHSTTCMSTGTYQCCLNRWVCVWISATRGENRDANRCRLDQSVATDLPVSNMHTWRAGLCVCWQSQYAESSFPWGWTKCSDPEIWLGYSGARWGSKGWPAFTLDLAHHKPNCKHTS